MCAGGVRERDDARSAGMRDVREIDVHEHDTRAVATVEGKQHIGRKRELALLRTLLGQARTGVGAAALVHGEAGVGGTRLVAEFRDGVPARTMLLSGRVEAQDEVRGQARYANPYAVLASALRRPVRKLEAREVRNIDRVLSPHDQALRPALAALRTDEQGTPVASVPEPIPPALMAEAVTRLLTMDSRSVLLVLENLHEAAPELLAVLRSLAEGLSSLPVLVVGTWRTGVAFDPASGTGGSHSEVLPLGRDARGIGLERFTQAQTRRLVRSCLNEQAVPERLYRYVEESCHGLPLHVEGLLATLAQLEGIAQDPQRNRWQLTGRLSLAKPLSFPETVRVRLEHRGPQSAAIVRTGAVVGMEFSPELLPRPPGVTGNLALDVPGGQRSPDQVLRRVRPGGYRFRHPLIREAVLALLTPAERADIAARLT